MSSPSQDQLKEMFEAIDTDRNGLIDRLEMKQAIAKRGASLSDAEFEKLFSAADANGDGQVNFEEFLQIYQ